VIRVKTFLSIAVLMCSSAFAQNPQPQQNDAERYRLELAERARQEAEQRDWETKIFQIKFVEPNELQRVLSMFRSNISVSGGGLRVLSVRAPKEIMPAIEDTIKRLDVPSANRDAELTIFILLASDQADGAAAVPAGLQPVVNQLKTVLSYKNYQLVDTLISHVSESGPANLRGSVTVGTMPVFYNFQSGFRIERPDGKPPILRLRGMRFGFQPGGRDELTVSTDVDVPQGQQVVVGKATMGDRAMILVMTSKFPN
jgi:hypothetical protein